MKYSHLAFRLFGRFTRGKRYVSLQEALRKARMPTTADVYVSMAFLSALLASAAGVGLGFVVGSLLGLSTLMVVLLVILVGASLGGLTYLLTIQYPGILASERARNIDLALPYAISFMHALSRSGATVVDIFRELSARTDVGEIQKEAQQFMRDIEYLGRDPLTALRSLARSTPSEKFRSFLEVLISIVETGGDIGPYLAGKVSEYHMGMKEENKKTVSTMELLTEIYIIIVQFLPLLMMAIFIYMGFMPGQQMNIFLLQLMAYLWVPLGSIIFAILLATIPPIELRGRPLLVRLTSPFKGIPVISGGEYDRRILKKLRGGMLSMKIKRFLSNPFRLFTQNPSYVLFFSIPAGILYLLYTPLRTLTLCIGFLIMVVPYTIFYEFRSRRATQLERSLPDFLKSLSSASRSGLPLARALQVTSGAELGVLSRELDQVGREIQWGSSATEALSKLEARVSISPTTARTITLIRRASEAEEDISDVIDIAFKDVQTRQEIAKERKSAMSIYRMIILMSFVIFIVTIFFIVQSYMMMPISMEAGEVKIQGLPPMDVKLLLYRLMIFQAMFTGIIAGQIGSGDVKSGLKFAILLLCIAILMFELIILPMGPAPSAATE